MGHVPGPPVAGDMDGDIADERPEVYRAQQEEHVEPADEQGRYQQAHAVEYQQCAAPVAQHGVFLSPKIPVLACTPLPDLALKVQLPTCNVKLPMRQSVLVLEMSQNVYARPRPPSHWSASPASATMGERA